MTKTMKNAVMASLVCVLCAAGTLIWSGCETASATEDLVISPSSVTLSSGQSQLFTVSGGYHYTWSLTGTGSSTSTITSAQGTLSSSVGSEVRYTAPSGSPLSGSVIIQVTSTIPGSSSATSNSPDYSVSGTATVTFQ